MLPKLLRQSLLAGENPAEAIPAVASFELVSDEAMEGKIIASRLSAQLLEAVAPGFDSVRRVTQFWKMKELGAQDVFRPEVLVPEAD